MSGTLATVADVVAAALILSGAFLALAAGVGIVRFPDLLARMHAATKPQVLGLVLVLLGVALRVRVWAAVGMLLLVVVFQLLTAPVAAHMVGRSGLRTGKVPPGSLVVDDLTADQVEADAEVEVDAEVDAPGPDD
ncbi:monovalent cation/H(+) antiporter subunit G [Luteimicrobium subarcticum]|uniref:Multisubunit sodium/proton antiporter MrpG subunit n=1 Tax=Luteimicrobium subarcticum TaxID=620910 RepID=A0A2M8WS87_9MICO|nr:monovalent cation/H(+) antiporter subunit G [Luteimicrobium subarcticum]PJI93744.1 multisubunit sodium/proton antiporter MrpG subunit [Luteimicrobium subarcticum]